jgi:outer membrane lipoprotein-sorting protein
VKSAFWALAILLIPSISQSADWDINQLMLRLAQTRSDHAHFVEKKTISILDKPAESSGELFYTAPDHLEKRTLKPGLESMIVDGGFLIIERGRQKHRLQLHAYPELSAFIDCIIGTLSGDRIALERSYRLVLEGSAEHWTLFLTPFDSKILAVVKHIHITGVQNTVRSIEIKQADGDSSLMIIEKLATP